MILMVQSSVMDIRKSNVLALCVLSMILLLLSCKQRLVEKDVIAGISDSICFQNALINHIKYKVSARKVCPSTSKDLAK